MQQQKLFQTDGLVAGVDEAGRGPLAGPVVAAAVILAPQATIAGLADSKKLSASRRSHLADEIRSKALAWSIGWADPAEIDAINILAATMLAMRRAILGLRVVPKNVLVDGNRLPRLDFARFSVGGDAVIGGDAKVASISAASIMAKTTRDAMMTELDRIYPGYEFARHKGYGTEIHRAKLREFGPCREHRQTFAPVRAAS